MGEAAKVHYHNWQAYIKANGLRVFCVCGKSFNPAPQVIKWHGEVPKELV